MENASKALIIAGTVLISLLVITLGILAFNKMSDYQKSRTDLVKDQQIAKFNEGFTQYISNETPGIDIITLVNKVIDYNIETIDYGVIDYNKKITLKIDMRSYNGLGESIFKKKIYETDYFYSTIVKPYTDMEKEYTISALGKLSSNIETLKLYYNNDDKINGKSVKQILGYGKNNSSINNLENDLQAKNFKQLEKYSEYAEFKSFKFKGIEPIYKNGQISKIEFEYVGR